MLFVSYNVLVLAIAYLGSIGWRCHVYSNKHSRWIGSAYEEDRDYGYFPRPDHIAYHSLRFGEKVPVLFDEEGFRVPLAEEMSPDPPERKILFLGGSFTHGYGVPAEQAFPYLVSRQLGARGLNAGGSGWGLVHMLKRARREIPRHRPDWVVVQYSEWLVKRAMDFYGPAIWGKSPGPYFYEADGNVRIHEPVFMSANFRLPISDYAGGGLLPFVWNVGIPLFAYDDFQVIRTAVRRGAGLLPAPASSRKVVVDFAYSEIHRLCEQTGAKMLILKLPGGFRDDTSYRDQLPDLHCPVVDSSPRLLARLPEASNTAWEKEYCFWRGEPLQIVDKHPNAVAHAVIADVVAEVIGETEGRYVTRGGRP